MFAYLLAKYGSTKMSSSDRTSSDRTNSDGTSSEVKSAAWEVTVSGTGEAIRDTVEGKRAIREGADEKQNSDRDRTNDRSMHEGEEGEGEGEERKGEERKGEIEGDGTKERRRQGENADEGEMGRAGLEGCTVSTFDFITVQLYEGYSHAQYDTQVRPSSFLIFIVFCFVYFLYIKLLFFDSRDPPPHQGLSGLSGQIVRAENTAQPIYLPILISLYALYH